MERDKVSELMRCVGRSRGAYETKLRSKQTTIEEEESTYRHVVLVLLRIGLPVTVRRAVKQGEEKGSGGERELVARVTESTDRGIKQEISTRTERMKHTLPVETFPTPFPVLTVSTSAQSHRLA
jgi:hypothetical protein